MELKSGEMEILLQVYRFIFPLFQVKANIKLTLEGLRELQRLAAEDMLEKKRRGAYDPLQ